MITQTQRNIQNALLKAFGYKWKKEDEGGSLRWVLYGPVGEQIAPEDALQEICLLCQPKPNHSSVQWAKNMLASDVLILDTETTGFSESAEVIDLALVDVHGNIRMHTLIQAEDAMEQAAADTHHITHNMLATAPTFTDIWEELRDLLMQHTILIYNAEYDMRILRQSASRHQLDFPEDIDADCIMKRYSSYIGQASEYREGYRHLSLQAACLHFCIQQSAAHRAIVDAKSALQVLEKLADVSASFSTQEDERKAREELAEEAKYENIEPFDLVWEGFYSEAVANDHRILSMHQEGESYIGFPGDTKMEEVHDAANRLVSARYTLSDGTVYILKDTVLSAEGE